MTGIIITNYDFNNFSLSKYNENDKCIYEEKKIDELTIQRLIVDKFFNDKIFFENKDFIILIEGVVLNSNLLIKKYNVKTLIEVILYDLYKGNDKFFEELRGSFCGFYYKKIEKKGYCFTNHTGDRPLFYYNENEKFIITSSVEIMLEFTKYLNISLTLNKNAVYYMITFGNMLDNSTYAKEIKRVLPGNYALIDNNRILIYEYYKFKRNLINTKNMTDDDIIVELDKRFNAAVKMEYDKDVEYGYNSYAHLSGGLDSRMSNFVAKELGYDNIMNFTYTQSNSYDEKIAKKMAFCLKHELWISYMDYPKFIFDVDKIVKKSGGLFIYIGMTNGYRCLEELNNEKTGLLHTGLIGDVVLGTIVNNVLQLYKKTYNGAYSKRYISKFYDSFDRIIDTYEDYEMFYLYTCAFLTNSSFPIIYQDFTESVSPFMNKEFIDFCYSIDIRKRMNRYIYFRWIKKLHKDAGEFVWTSSHVKVNDKFYFIKRCIMSIIKKIKLGIYGDVNDMNPMEMWYKTIPEIRKFIDKYIEVNLNVDVIDDDLRKILIDYNKNATCCEKMQLMTALSSIKLYF